MNTYDPTPADELPYVSVHQKLPEPIVIYTEGEPAWLPYDAAQRSLDPQEDKRALALALMEVA